MAGSPISVGSPGSAGKYDDRFIPNRETLNADVALYKLTSAESFEAKKATVLEEVTDESVDSNPVPQSQLLEQQYFF